MDMHSVCAASCSVNKHSVFSAFPELNCSTNVLSKNVCTLHPIRYKERQMRKKLLVGQLPENSTHGTIMNNKHTPQHRQKVPTKMQAKLSIRIIWKSFKYTDKMSNCTHGIIQIKSIVEVKI
jgi:hypothetical protein